MKLMPRLSCFFLEAILPLLLDTCIIYAWMMGTLKDNCCIEKIQAEGGLVSSVAAWEMAIKNGLGKMPLPSTQIATDIESQGFQWLNITPYHTQAILELPDHHKDPFDRLLIAQAKYENLRVISYDSIFEDYLDDVLIIKKQNNPQWLFVYTPVCRVQFEAKMMVYVTSASLANLPGGPSYKFTL